MIYKYKKKQMQFGHANLMEVFIYRLKFKIKLNWS